MTAKQKKFVNSSLSEQVRIAMEDAADVVCAGVDMRTCTDNDVCLKVEHLIGHCVVQTDATDEECTRVSEAMHTAYAVGIAVGLLLRPEAFTGGAK